MSAPSDERATVDFSNPIDRENAIRIGRAWIELRRGAWTANLRDYLYGDDDPLEQGQMDALDLLTRSDRTMRGLAARLRIDPSSATRAVQRLVDDGLAERFPSPDDGRVVMVRITKDGRARHADVDARRSHTMALILSEFTPHERADLAVMLDRFVDALDHVCERLDATHAGTDVTGTVTDSASASASASAGPNSSGDGLPPRTARVPSDLAGDLAEG